MTKNDQSHFSLFPPRSQIEAADKQLKATRQFLEDQAAEREQERDEFSKEIEKLRVIVKEKDKDITSQDNHRKEVRHFFIHLELLSLAQNTKLLCTFLNFAKFFSVLFTFSPIRCTIEICMLKNKKLDVDLVIDHVSLVSVEKNFQ